MAQNKGEFVLMWEEFIESWNDYFLDDFALLNERGIFLSWRLRMSRLKILYISCLTDVFNWIFALNYSRFVTVRLSIWFNS